MHMVARCGSGVIAVLVIMILPDVCLVMRAYIGLSRVLQVLATLAYTHTYIYTQGGDYQDMQ